MNKEIEIFINKQTCATICCIDAEGNPYCFTVFIAFNSDQVLLYFKSSAATQHSKFIHTNPKVAGTILPNKLSRFSTQGIQFQGVILVNENPLTLQATTHYYKRHPLALGVPGEVYTLQLNQIKYSGLHLGIKTKLSWSRDEMSSKSK